MQEPTRYATVEKTYDGNGTQRWTAICHICQWRGQDHKIWQFADTEASTHDMVKHSLEEVTGGKSNFIRERQSPFPHDVQSCPCGHGDKVARNADGVPTFDGAHRNDKRASGDGAVLQHIHCVECEETAPPDTCCDPV